MGDTGRVIELPNGGKRVVPPKSKISIRKQKQLLEFVAAGMSIAAAAKAAEVKPDAVYRLRKVDEDFAAQLSVAMEAFGGQLEELALERARNGSDKLLERMLEARVPAYKRDRGAKTDVNVNVMVPLVASELSVLRDVGRVNIDELDAIAEEMNRAERGRESKRIGDGG